MSKRSVIQQNVEELVKRKNLIIKVSNIHRSQDLKGLSPLINGYSTLHHILILQS